MGLFTFFDGSFYHGEFKDDLKDGLGVLTQIKGTYSGSWKEDVRSGYGI